MSVTIRPFDIIMLNNKQVKLLKSYAHHLQTTVSFGNKGITDQILNEVRQTIAAHELIKIKINRDTKQERDAIALEICNKVGAEFVQLIGKQAVLFKQNQENSKFKI